MRRLTSLLLLVAGCAAMASENLFPDPDLSRAASWTLPPGYRWEPGAGRNGGNALVYERADPAAYPLGAIGVQLGPGSYEFGGWAFVEAVASGETSAAICMEISRDGQHVGGSYVPRIAGPGDWRQISGVLNVPENGLSIQFVPYMLMGHTGKIRFCDFFIRRQELQSYVTMLAPRQPHAIPAGMARYELGVQVMNADREVHEVRLAVRDAGGGILHEAAFPLRGQRVAFDLELPPGEYTLTCTPAIDGAPSDSVAFTVVEAPEAARVALDERGRLRVGGEKFLPIGLYLNRAISGRFQPSLDREIAAIGAADFNCILPYDGLGYRLDGSEAQYPESVREVYDACRTAGLMVIPSLDYMRHDPANTEKTIKALADHPALLAWYLSDEQPVEERNAMRRRNAAVNRLDPEHPTLGVYLQPDAMLQYGNTCNIYGFDQYPIYGGTRSIGGLDTALGTVAANLASGDGMALWSIPQWMNWVSYNSTPGAQERYRWPTAEETLTMSLLAALHGARGFIFYSYFDMFTSGVDEYEQRWPEICFVARELAELAPCLLGDAEVAAPTPLRQSGNLRFGAFRSDDGRDAIVIAATGPGESSADFALPGEWRSNLGHTVRQPDGTWRFTGNDIACDILWREP